MKEAYYIAKAAKAGDRVRCPSCNKGFVKRSYQQAFCCNRGFGNCKDAFWNRATPERAARAANINGGDLQRGLDNDWLNDDTHPFSGDAVQP